MNVENINKTLNKNDFFSKKKFEKDKKTKNIFKR